MDMSLATALATTSNAMGNNIRNSDSLEHPISPAANLGLDFARFSSPPSRPSFLCLLSTLQWLSLLLLQICCRGRDEITKKGHGNRTGMLISTRGE